MFRSMSNFKGMTFDEDEEDPGSCISNAAMGFHNEEMSSFITTSIPHDKKDKSEFRISPYGSLDSLSEDKIEKEKVDQTRLHKKLSRKVHSDETGMKPQKSMNRHRQGRAVSQELDVERLYEPRKSMVRRFGRGFSLDNYREGGYLRDNFGNVYVHMLPQRASSMDGISEFTPPGDTKVFNNLKSSINKWRRNVRTKKSKQNLDDANGKKTVLSIGKRLPDSETIKQSKQSDNVKIMKGQRMRQDCDYTDYRVKYKQSVDSKEKVNATANVIELEKKAAREQRNVKAKKGDVERLSKFMNKEEDDNGYIHDFGTATRLNTSPSHVRVNFDSEKQTRNYFSPKSVRYYTVMKNETKQYVSAVSWNLK